MPGFCSLDLPYPAPLLSNTVTGRWCSSDGLVPGTSSLWEGEGLQTGFPGSPAGLDLA